MKLDKLACLMTIISSITSFDYSSDVDFSSDEIWAIIWVFLDEAKNAAHIP